MAFSFPSPRAAFSGTAYTAFQTTPSLLAIFTGIIYGENRYPIAYNSTGPGRACALLSNSTSIHGSVSQTCSAYLDSVIWIKQHGLFTETCGKANHVGISSCWRNYGLLCFTVFYDSILCLTNSTGWLLNWGVMLYCVVLAVCRPHLVFSNKAWDLLELQTLQWYTTCAVK